jgi:hypothetical protein
MQTTLYTIYKITNKTNNKIYVGKHQTSDIDDGYMGSGKILKHAIVKYGIEQFTKEILHIFDNEYEMNDKEAELVTAEFVLLESNYNLCVGGQGGFSYINSNKNITVPRNRKNVVNANTPAAKLKAAANTDYTKLGFSVMPKDKLHELRQRAVEKNIGCKRSEAAKKKMSVAGTGKNNSQFGSMWITDGTDTRKILRTDDIPINWYKGRTKKKNLAA